VHRSHMELNYFGVLNTVKAVYEGMVKRRSGHVCIVGSAMSTMGALASCTAAACHTF
jgi:short-subunit dehydrogenase